MPEGFAQEGWLAWGVGLLIGFPLLAVLFGEMLFRAENAAGVPTRSLGRALLFVLPSLVVYLLFTRVLELDDANVWVRIAASAFWIGAIYLALALFNMVWSRGAEDEASWRNKVPTLVINIARLFFILLGFAFVVSTIWGVDLGKMLAALGVGSIVLGLALQDTLGGLFAGITLISARQFNVGDWIKAGDVVGQVVTVNWYSVSLRTFEDDLLVIPNSVLARDTFRNYSRPNPLHMERIVIQFSEELPPNRVREALLEAARLTPGVLDAPPPQVMLRELADDAGAYEAHLFFDDYARIDGIRDAYLTHAWYAAKRHGLVFPIEDHQVFHFRGREMNLGSDDRIAPEQLADTLAELDLFSLPREVLETFSEGAAILRYGKGERIIQEGQRSDAIYVLLTGHVHTFAYDAEGKAHSMGTASPGELFGIVSALRHRDSLVSVFADSDVQVARLKPERMEDVLQAHPEVAQEVEQAIDARLESIEALRRRDRDRHGMAPTRSEPLGVTHDR